jgi:hypothetical protein
MADAGPLGPVSFPQVVNHQGPVLATPHVVPIFFQGDTSETALEDFMTQLASSSSSFWGDVTSEYGVGALSIGSSIVVSDMPPAMIDTAGIESWLTGHLDADAGWPPVDSSSVFVVFYPSGTTVADPLFGTSCTDFNGFHYQGIVDTSLVYAIIPRCASAGPLVGIDGLTATLSHELVEVATDPFLQTMPAWAYTDEDHLIWSFVPGAEVADMCSLEPQSVQQIVGSYYVQRPWSNKSALAGHDPCVPTLSQPYFNAAPVLDQSVSIAFQMQYVQTRGIDVPLGQTRTIAVQLFGDSNAGTWSVQALDTKSPAGLTFSWDKTTGTVGDVLHLTITRTADSSDEFILESTSGMTANLWFGYVAD